MGPSGSADLSSLPGTSPALVDYQYQIGDLVLGPGTSYLVNNVEGFGTPDVRTSDEERTQEDGDWVGDDTYGSRTVTLTITVRGAGAAGVNDAYKALLAAWRFERTLPWTNLWWKWPGEAPMRLIGRPRRVQADRSRMLSGTIKLVAEFYSPFAPIYGEATTQVASPRIVTGGGRTYGGTRTNLFPNPSLEVDTSGWFASTNTTIARSTAQAYSGAASLTLTATSTGQTVAFSTTNVMTATAGQTYTASAYFRAAATSRNCHIELWFRTAGGADISSINSSDLPDNTSGWTRIDVSGVAPATTAFVYLTIRIGATGGGNAAGEVHYVDGVLVEQSAALDSYFDGSYNGAAWAGTANNSASTVTGMVYPRQYNVTVVGGEVVTIDNDGSYPAWAILTMTGTSTDPRLADLTNGQYLAFGLSLSGADKLVVDMRLRTAYKNGVNVRHLIIPGSSWWSFPEGSSDLLYLPTSYDGTAQCEIKTATAHLG